MSSTRTRADALSMYLTGAAGAGGVQADPDLSLGGHRSSSRAGTLGYLLSGSLPGVRIDYAAGENGSGIGALDAAGVDELVWTPPGGTQGDPVAIADGEQKLLEGGDGDASKFILVTRTSAEDLAGGYTVELLPVFNDVIGSANWSTDGFAMEYRCVCLKNGPGGVVKDLKVWLGTNTNAVAIAKEDPASQPDGAFQTIPDPVTAPTGLSFVSPTSAVHVDVITVARLNPNEQLALWIRRDMTLASATARAQVAIAWSYTLIG